ncbi:MAG: hypothetical protein IJY09_05040 [Lachnospiraceae bacterium]|nr:hypothetical protein [Lachnospiraceae bacterium]
MKWMYKLERKLGRYTIKNLPLCLILCYATGYILEMINPNLLQFLTLNPYQILHGQVWRLVTWILIPPESFSFFTLLMLYFYYSIGTNLERVWGTFRFNFYLLGGMIFTIIGSFLMMGYGYWKHPEYIEYLGAKEFFTSLNYAGHWFSYFSTYYINMSIFLAFAATFPYVTVNLMYIIPIQIRYLGIIYALMLGYQFIMSGVVIRIVIGASLLNFVVFFLLTRNYRSISPKEIHRRQSYKKKVRDAAKGSNVTQFRGRNVITRHKCAVCGRTELDDDMLEFRFCSKCDGNYEYCMEHLYTHEHVHKD